ncbi:MAG TPA: DNA gyrase inhibitor YacG [Terriglobia bacterium]|jgi:endogenous inhibitor of DNA gyrase (YacG/DUF329 family)|nr:DNA gyrase inhibitor YacG [Terriglobia bacterium]
MRCPICKKEVSYKGNPFRPFCSERCKMIDLDNWLSERYRISNPAEESSAREERAGEEQDATRDRG